MMTNNYPELEKISTNKLILENNEINGNEIIGGKLTWYPWIGDKYNEATTKILIVGESHYFNLLELGSFEKHTKRNFTQIVVNEIAIYRLLDDKRQATMYENFYNSIKKENQSRFDFWHSVSFYNFIQQPMNSIKERPDIEMVPKAWQTFKSVISIINPDVVIFIGVKACSKFNQDASQLFDNSPTLQTGKLITNRQVPRNSEILINNKLIKIHFIKHTSSYYSRDKWREYFKEMNIISK